MKKGILVGLVLGFAAGPSFAALQDDLRDDSTKVAGWFSEQIAEAVAYDSGVSPILPADVLKPGRVEVGVNGHGSASDLHRDEFRNLPVKLLDVNNTARFDLPEKIGMAGGVLYGKVGLPFGMDIGAKIGGIHVNRDKTEVNNTVFGFELRKRILGGEGLTGVALPDLAVSLGYDGAKGDATRTEHYNGPLINGQTLDADVRWRTEWNVGAISGKLSLSKTVAIFTPYIGLGLSKNAGDARTVNTITGTSSAGSVSETSTASSNADMGFLSLFFGGDVAFFPFFHLNLGVTLTNEHAAGSLGLRFRIG